tara:strand:+ start:246 stop:422 length:177 start_codon:yes stop_codon:yes gene_type:complete
MGEVIVLADWKKKKEIESLNLLESEVESLMDFLNVQREFFMFDASGHPILIHSEGACK